MHHLVALEQKALEHVRANEPEKAAPLFAQIVAECPNWEHGEAFYNLACCYEDMGGHLEDARHCFLEALKVEPYNPYYLGGYASYLFIHGKPEEAYKVFLTLLKVERHNHFIEEQISKTMRNLKALAQKLELSEESLKQDIEAACQSGFD